MCICLKVTATVISQGDTSNSFIQRSVVTTGVTP